MINLFLLCPAGAGSSVIADCLARCKNTSYIKPEWDLHHTDFFPHGHISHRLKDYEPNLIKEINEAYYDWDKINEFLDSKHEKGKTVRIHKSPRDLYRWKMIEDNVENAVFILSIPDALTYIEGRIRKAYPGIDNSLENAAKAYKNLNQHIDKFFRKKHNSFYTFFTFPNFCSLDPEVISNIKSILPDFDLDYSYEFQHDHYDKAYPLYLGLERRKKANESFSREELERILELL